MDEKEPTQQTQPVKGEPITIPVPTRGEIDDALAKVSKPLPAKSKKRRRGTAHQVARRPRSRLAGAVRQHVSQWSRPAGIVSVSTRFAARICVPVSQSWLSW